MNIAELIKQAAAQGVFLSTVDGNLKFQLSVPEFPVALKATIVAHKQQVIDFLEALNTSSYCPPQNLIADKNGNIKPADINMVQLTEQDIQLITDCVPGGSANIEDIYPLNPLQEGILFHHMVSPQEDIYLSWFALKISNKTLLHKLLNAFHALVPRHDTLRTIFLWEQLAEPLQIVLREAQLAVKTVRLETGASQEAAQHAMLQHRCGGISLKNAPLMKLTMGEVEGQEVCYLLVEHHHLITDHIGLDILVEELVAAANGLINHLPLPTPYRNLVAYAKEQNQARHGINWFKQQLADLTSASLLFDIVPASDIAQDFNMVTESLDTTFSSRIRSVASQYKVSAASLFHVAWALVAAQCSGQQEVVFGTVLSGRLNSFASAQRSMGLAINTLPLRVALQGVSVEEAIRQVAVDLNTLIGFEQTPLTRVLESSSPHEVLFNSIVNYRHSSMAVGTDQVFKGLDILAAQEQTNYPITLNVDDLGDAGFNLVTLCSTGANAQRLTDYMLVALETVMAHLETASNVLFSSLSVLPEAEQQALLFDLNDTHGGYPLDKGIQHLFEAQVAMQPQQLAVVFEEQQLTYGELNHQVNQLAARLVQHHQVGAGVLVGLCLERSTEMLVAILATLKAGGAYVPLDPGYPLDRLEYMCEDANINLVLGHTQTAPVLRAFNGAVLMLDTLEDSTDDHPIETLHQADFSSEQLAYVIYTSGSTGKPKGVMVEHRGVVNFLYGMQQNLQLQPHDRVLSLTSINFDIHVLELFLTWSQGGTLVLANEQQKREPACLAALIARQQVSLAQATPSTWKMLIDSGWCSEQKMTVLCGGEALPVSLLTALQARLPNCQLYNMYGPTETTVWSSMARLDNDQSHLGRPILNTQLYLLDEQQKLLPKGAVGELYIGGDGLTRGYLNRPEQTAQRFIENPFYAADKPNSSTKLYRTGDLARYLSDGKLAFVGRADDQVKIRGFRIELSEIELHLAAIDGVNEAVVTAKEVADAMQLVAYIKADTPPKKEAVFIKSVRQALRQNLPGYMVPGIIMLMNTWPMTQNRKINRGALPAPDAHLIQGEYVAPESDAEQCLAEVWAALLKMDKGGIGKRDNFFDLGGHSLLIPGMITHLNQSGFALSAADIYHAIDLQSIAMTMRPAGDVTSAWLPVSQVPDNAQQLTPQMFDMVTLLQADIDNIAAKVQGGQRNIKDILPLTSLQQSFLFQHFSNAEDDHYWQSIIMKISADNLAHFIDAINQVIARHDALRSVYLSASQASVAVVLKAYRLRVATHSLLPAQQNGGVSFYDQVDALAHDTSVNNQPPILLVVGNDKFENQCYVKLMTHHLMLDQVGGGIVIDEVLKILSGQGHLLSWPAPYRGVLGHIMQHSHTEQARDFFRQKLNCLSSASTVVGLTQASFCGRILSKEVIMDRHTATKLRAATQLYNSSPAAFFHTVFAVLMSVVANKKDVVFGTVFSGRQTTPAGSEKAVGMFMNTLPFRVNVQQNSVTDLMTIVQQSLPGYVANEHFSLNEAKKYTDLDIADSLVNGVLNFRRGVATVEQQEVIQLMDEEDKMVPTSPLILIVSDDGTDFHVMLKVDERINLTPVWGMLNTVIVNLINDLQHQGADTDFLNDLCAITNTSLLQSDATGNDAARNSFVAQQLIQLWHELFGIDFAQLTASTSLWECGSVVALTQVTARINQQFNIAMTRSELVQHHTFEQQITYITNALISGASAQSTADKSTEEFGVI